MKMRDQGAQPREMDVSASVHSVGHFMQFVKQLSFLFFLGRCSMALVHSRISRVFYGVPYPCHGGLGSVFKVHCQRGINHHFEVYRGVLRDDCARLYDY